MVVRGVVAVVVVGVVVVLGWFLVVYARDCDRLMACVVCLVLCWVCVWSSVCGLCLRVFGVCVSLRLCVCMCVW